MHLASYLRRFRHAFRRHGCKQRGARSLWLQCLEERTLLSVQFTPGPYAVPGSRPDTPLTEISNFRPVEPYLSINDQDPGQVAVSSHNGVRVTSNDGGSFSNVGTFRGSTGGGN